MSREPLPAPSGKAAGPAFPVRESALTVGYPPRERFAGVNLKSCELQHPWADQLVTEALGALRPADVWAYPVQRDLLVALGTRHGVPAGRVLLTAGSDAAIGLLVDAFAVPAGRLILPEPSFEAWSYYAALRGVPVTAPRQVTGRPPRLDGEALLDAVRSHPPSVVALTNPASPSGLLVQPEEVKLLAEECHRHGHLLVIDECYAAFAGVTHVPLVESHPRVVVVRSYSKSHALAGSRIAAVFATEEITGHLSRYRPDSSLSAPAMALLSRLLGRVAEFEEVWRDVRAIRARFADAVERARPGWQRMEPGGNFVTFHTGSVAVPPLVERALLGHGFRIRALSGVPGLEECLRVSMADRDTMDRVAEALCLLEGVPGPDGAGGGRPGGDHP